MLKHETQAVTLAPRGSVFWTLYLLFAIVLVGAPGCALGAPWILLGRLNRRVELWAGRYACAAIRFMFSLNYWINVNVRLNIPFAIGRAANERCLIVANHRSNLDVFLIISNIPNVRILAKRELFFVPFLGFMMWVMRNIAIRRGDLQESLRAMERVRKGLRHGDPVVVFPEGRRCPAGYEGLQRFHSAAFRIAKEENVPIIPLVFVDTDTIWPKGSLGMNPSGSATVVSLDKVDPSDFDSVIALQKEVEQRMYKALTTYASRKAC